jgi:hypothetical protein
VFEAFAGNPASLGLVTFQNAARIGGSACQTLARFTTGDTALIECPAGDGRATAIPRQEAYAGSQTAPGAVAHHGDAGGVHTERRGVVGEPAECCVTVLTGAGCGCSGAVR